MSTANEKIVSILGSKGKIKILLFLSQAIESNITRIARETGLHHNVASRHLKDLVELGLLEERIIGRVKIYSLNYSNPITLLVLDILRKLSE